MTNLDNAGFATSSPNGFTQTTTPNPDQGLYSNNLPLISPTVGNKIAIDVPSHDGAAPSSGFMYNGSFLGLANPWVAGQAYGTMGTTPVSFLTVASTMYAFPFYVPNTVLIKTLNVNVLTGQTGGAAHLGIYADNGAGYPGALVYDTGAITGLTGTAVGTNTPSTSATASLVAGTAFNMTSSFGITGSGGATLANNTLVPGLYWSASLFTATTTFISVAAATHAYNSFPNIILGSDTVAHLLAAGSEAASGLSVTQTYGALPATFTTGATLNLNTDTPFIGYGL